MSNAIKALIERQAATSDACGPSFAFAGRQCSHCDNSFSLGDLSLSIEGAPEGKRSHSNDKTDRNATGLHETALAVVAELREFLAVLGDCANLRATMAGVLATGRMVELTKESS